MIGRDINKYNEEYASYFNKNEINAKARKTMLDPAPRVILDKKFGLCAVGKNMSEIGIISDIYEHTMESILRAEKLGGFEALPANDIFDLEYWDLEQAKLLKNQSPLAFEGEVVLITGAASGIGKACVESFLHRGSAVIALDIDPSIKTINTHKNYLGLICDVTNEDVFEELIEKGIQYFGGLDMVVLNAGCFQREKKFLNCHYRNGEMFFLSILMQI